MERTVYDRMAEMQSAHWWYEGRRRILHDLIADMDLPEEPSILEAGCGPGANISMLRGFGVVKAFEPDEKAREHAAFTTGISPLPGSLPFHIPFSESFDLVGAFDVIEHVEDDAAACQSLHDLLNPEGYALFTVPAYAWLWSDHDVSNQHFRRYTRAGLRDLLGASGFTGIRVSYFNTILFPAVAAVRGVRKLTGSESGGDDKMPKHDSVNRGLTRVFSVERHVVRRASLPVGVSLVAVARR